MFSWKVGEFSFEIRDEIDDRDRELMLTTGINAQYLTMEATRIGDESEKHGADDDIHFGTVDEAGTADESVADEVALTDISTPDTPVEEIEVEVSAADGRVNFELLPVDIGNAGTDAGAASDADDTEPEMHVVAADLAAAEHIALAAVERVEAGEDQPATRPVSQPSGDPVSASDCSPAPARPASITAIVIIDPNLAALEWQKSVLGPICQRIHIFQRSENGIARIRQYLRRGDAPHVLVSNDVPSDPLSGIDGPTDLMQRLRAHAPRMPIFLVRSGDANAEGSFETLRRPANHQLANRRSWERLEAAGAELRAALARGHDVASPASVATGSAATETPADRFSASSLRRLKSMSDRLRDPTVRGEVLSLILEFAAESFSRVAIFMVRDDDAVGMAQSGLERAGGPGNEAFREIVIPARGPSWFRNVLDRREGLRAPPSDEGDRELAELLGGSIPQQAYVAPIESSHRVVALVYVDNLPDDAPIAETASLEIFLHEAGLALERALLERALADASGRSSA